MSRSEYCITTTRTLIYKVPSLSSGGFTKIEVRYKSMKRMDITHSKIYIKYIRYLRYVGIYWLKAVNSLVKSGRG